LLHARFLTKALADIGLVAAQEPYQHVSALGRVTRDGTKISASKRNAVNPARYLARYGIDTMRCYILFMGPPDRDLTWTDARLDGLRRFLSRFWTLGDELAQSTATLPESPAAADLELLTKTHQAILTVTEIMDGDLQMHKAIASIMGLLSESIRVRHEVAGGTLRFTVATVASLLFPFAPHCSADVYHRLTGERVWESPWPVADPAYLRRENIEILVQVDGKLRARVQAPYDATPEQLKQAARRSELVRECIAGREIDREVVVPGRLVNFVTA
jgi:leucyl-tRNA synthetase